MLSKIICSCFYCNIVVSYDIFLLQMKHFKLCAFPGERGTFYLLHDYIHLTLRRQHKKLLRHLNHKLLMQNKVYLQQKTRNSPVQ